MKMNDIISMLAPKKSNDLLNSFIESIILGGTKTYDVDESVLRGDDKQTGMMVPPNRYLERNRMLWILKK